MSTLLDIEKQQFVFGDQWIKPFKYDDTDFYRREVNPLQGKIDDISQSSKAVDIVGLHQAIGLLLLEAKDFRGHRIPNKSRIKTNEVALEVAVKVRDTVAAFVGASRKLVNDFPSGDLMAALEKGRSVTVVLWLEDDTFRDPSRAKQTLLSLNGVLKEKLAWLNVKTVVLSSCVDNKLPNLTVSNLPGAGQPDP